MTVSSFIDEFALLTSQWMTVSSFVDEFPMLTSQWMTVSSFIDEFALLTSQWMTVSSFVDEFALLSSQCSDNVIVYGDMNCPGPTTRRWTRSSMNASTHCV